MRYDDHLPDELLPDVWERDRTPADASTGGHGLGIRVTALFVALTLVVMTVGIMVFTTGFGIPL
ncbi:MAG: hypothetical protein Q4F65_10780 [Propionibacteriaceae bacterium]|nr:hypothetical protein [Propionibacteriaceae bacterium]